jgi:hypothetical protein
MNSKFETQDAINKINEINSIIQASNKALLSGSHMILGGVLALLVFVVGPLTQDLTFGHDFGAHAGAYIAVINTAFYWTLATLISRFILKKKRRENSLHPLIAKAFSLNRPILFALIGIIVVLSFVQQEQLIYPMVMILLGTLFAVYGKFTLPLVTYISWTYILAGLMMIYLQSYPIAHLEYYFLAYQGLSLIAMGSALRREEKTHAL